MQGTEKCLLHKFLSLGKFSIVHGPILYFFRQNSEIFTVLIKFEQFYKITRDQTLLFIAQHRFFNFFSVMCHTATTF